MDTIRHVAAKIGVYCRGLMPGWALSTLCELLHDEMKHAGSGSADTISHAILGFKWIRSALSERSHVEVKHIATWTGRQDHMTKLTWKGNDKIPCCLHHANLGFEKMSLPGKDMIPNHDSTQTSYDANPRRKSMTEHSLRGNYANVSCLHHTNSCKIAMWVSWKANLPGKATMQIHPTCISPICTASTR